MDNQTLNKLAYRKLYLFADYHIINSTHLFYDSSIPYIRHRPYLNRLKERILQTDGGAFLITGFRGVGKSTLIYNAISELNKEKNAMKFIKASIVLSSGKDYLEILYEIIRRLYESLSKESIWKMLSSKTKDRIRLAYARTSLYIKHSEYLGAESEYSLSIATNSASIFKGKNTCQTADEATYIAFTEDDVEYELIQIIDAIRHERQSAKIVIIFDEIDKLTCEPSGEKCFHVILSRIKNLISATDSLFVFVAGIDVYEKWENDRGRINSLYDSLFNWHLYLPCIWDSIELLFNMIEEKKYVYESIDLAFEELVCKEYTKVLQPAFRLIRDYILFRGKGIPRKVITVFNDFVSWDKKKPYFLLTSKLTKGILQISKLCEKFYTYIDKNTFRTVIEKDVYCSVFLSMLDYLFFKPDFIFTKKEITTSLLYENELFILNFDKIVDDLLNVFINERIIRDNGENYEVVDASILQRDQALSILDANIIIEHNEIPISNRESKEDSYIDTRFREQIKLLKNQDAINFWKPFKAKGIIAKSEELMSFSVENTLNRSGYYAIIFTPKNREKIRKLGSLYSVGSYRFCNRYLIDTTDIIKNGAPETSLRKAIEGYSLTHIISAKVKYKYIYLIIKQIFDFLDILHEKNFFNVRLNPDNILICKDGCLKILDLQHMCKVDSDLSPYPTRIYSAPEIYSSKHDFASDYYSVAILLFELVLGVNLSSVCFERHIDIDNYSEDIKCSKKLWKVMKRATSFDVSDRFSDSQAFLRALDKCSEFRFYKNMKIPRSDEGTVTNHVVISEACMNSHIHDSVEFDSQRVAETGETVMIGGGYFGDTSTLENANLHAEQMFPYLLRVKTNEIIKIGKSDFSIGKEKLRVDYHIEDNAGISKIHCSIIIHDKKCFIIDHNSTNHTYVNQIIVPPQTEINLVNGDIIRLANEEFIFSEGK